MEKVKVKSSTLVILFVVFLFMSASGRKHASKKLQTPDFLHGNDVVEFSQSRTKNTPVVAEKFVEEKQRQSVKNVVKRIVETGKLKYCSILIYNSNPIKSEMYGIFKLNRDMYILNEQDGTKNNKTMMNMDEENETAVTTLNTNLITNSVKKLKKLGANCILSLIFLPENNNNNHYREKVLKKVHDKLTTFPIISPWTKRNKDYYIFFTNDPSQIDKILLSPHTSFRFTYKLAIGIFFSNYKSELVGKTLCFYCAHGSSLVVNVDLTPSDNDDGIVDIDRFFPNMFKNFNGGIIKGSAVSVGVSVQMQKEKVTNDNNNNVDSDEWNWRPFKTGGTFLRSFISASEALNFTYLIRAGGGSGLKLKDGSYNGVIGDVLSGKVDVGVVTGITLSRLAILDFTTALDYLTLNFVHDSPDEIYSWKFIFWPFSVCLWWCIILTLILAIGFLLVLSYFERKEWDSAFTRAAPKKKKVWTLEKILLFILPTCLGQHFTRAEILSFRCFAGNWHLFIIIISTAYLSVMYLFFIKPPLENAPSTFDELPTSTYAVGMTYYGGAIYSWFKNAQNGTTMHQIYRKMEKRKNSDCLIETLVHKYVCISYKTSILHAIRVEIGDKYGRSSLIIEPAVGFELPIGFSLEKKSILIESLSFVTSSNFESGLTNFWRYKTYDELRAERLKKEAEQMRNSTIIDSLNIPVINNEPIRLKINHFRGAFTIYIFGSCLAFIIFFTEYVVLRWHCLLKRFLYQLGVKYKYYSIHTNIGDNNNSDNPSKNNFVKRVECLPCC